MSSGCFVSAFLHLIQVESVLFYFLSILRCGSNVFNTQKCFLILVVLNQARRAAAAEARRDEGDEVASECSSSAQEEDTSLFEDLFTAVMMSQDSDGRALHTAFQLLPSKKVRKLF